MSIYDDLKVRSIDLAKENIRAIGKHADGSSKRKISRADAIYYAVRDGVDEAVPKVVDEIWCIAVLAAKPSILERRVVRAAPISFAGMLREVVIDTLEGEIETELQEYAATIEDAETASPAP